MKLLSQHSILGFKAAATASRLCSCGREPMLAIRKWSAPFRLPISQSNASAICSAAICSDCGWRRWCRHPGWSGHENPTKTLHSLGQSEEPEASEGPPGAPAPQVADEIVRLLGASATVSQGAA
jgi:hypothetical protein